MQNILKRTTLIVRDAERSRRFYVDEVHRRLEDWGARIHAAPHAFEVRGADGHLVRMVTDGFFDPDGYFFEVNERHAA